MKPTLKIDFTYFWSDFIKTDNLFYNLLSEKYEVQISDKPDIIFYSVFDKKHLEYNCLRVFYTGEPVSPNWLECDFAFGFNHIPNRKKYYRLPLWVLNTKPEMLIAPKPTIDWNSKKFCCMVVSNPNCIKRNLFFEKLSKYKQVDSGGRYANNVGGPIVDKLAFISEYKFVLSFENTSFDGYTTEKLCQPMREYSIPVYWGNKYVGKDFNTKSFVNHHEYKDDEAVIKKIIELDNNPILMNQMWNEPWFVDNKIPEFAKYENIAKQLFYIAEQVGKQKPIAQTYKRNIAIIYDKTKKNIVTNKQRATKLLNKIIH